MSRTASLFSGELRHFRAAGAANTALSRLRAVLVGTRSPERISIVASFSERIAGIDLQGNIESTGTAQLCTGGKQVFTL